MLPRQIRWQKQHRMYHLAVLNSHPIQYFAPFYRRLSLEPDIDLTVFYCSRKGLDTYFDIDFDARIRWDIDLLQGYKYEFLPNVCRNTEGHGFFTLVNPSIIKRLKSGNFDAILIHGYQYSTNLLAVLGAKLSKTALFMRCDTHSLLRRSPVKSFLRKLFLLSFYNQFDACLAIGSRNYQFYNAHKVPREKIFLVPFSVVNQFFVPPSGFADDYKREIRADYNLPQKKPLILFVSKLQERKHPLHLLEAYALLRRKGLDSALLFVGSGEQKEILEDYVRLNSVPEVTFLGFRNQSELPRLFSIADIFVLPSENEPWGLVINEAMAAGLPVIVSEEIGAVPDLVHDNFNGFTFPVGDIHTLSQQMQVLINDQELRLRMGAASREIIEDWDYERGVRGMRAALSSLPNCQSD